MIPIEVSYHFYFRSTTSDGKVKILMAFLKSLAGRNETDYINDIANNTQEMIDDFDIKEIINDFDLNDTPNFLDLLQITISICNGTITCSMVIYLSMKKSARSKRLAYIFTN